MSAEDQNDSKTFLQEAIERALAAAPKPRDHYDRIIQQKNGTKGKPIYDIQRGKSKRPGLDTIQAIADAFGMPVEDFLEGVSERPEPNGFTFKMEGASTERMRNDLPIYGTALGASRQIDGEAIEQTTLNRAEVVQYVKRPVLLNGKAEAYGLFVSGSSMEPRHMDGETILVDPKGRVKPGEDVVVYLRPIEEHEDDGHSARAVLVKRLVRRTAAYVELEQYSPAKVFRIEMIEVVRIDRVIPWSEMLG